jgi:hypothetical protein
MMSRVSEPPGFPPYPSQPRLPVSQPPRYATPGHRIGRAQGVQTRVEGHGRDAGSETVLTFRLLDADGGRPADVELRSRSLSGTVQEGDWVEVVDRKAPSGRYQVAQLSNLTTGAVVETARGVAKGVRVLLAVVFVLIFVTVLGFIIAGIALMAGS